MSDNTMMEEGKTMNPVEKVFGILLAPTQTFRALREKSEVWIPIIIVPVMMALYYVLFWSSYEVTLIEQLETTYASMGMDVNAAMIEQAVGMQRVITPISTVVGFFIMLTLSAVYYLVCSKIAKGELTFGSAFVLSAYASLVVIVSEAFKWIMTLVLGQYNVMMPMTSLASLLPESMQGTLLYYASVPVEIFAIWSMIITFIGLRVMGKLSQKAAGITVGLQFALILLMSVGTGLLMSASGM